MSIKAISSALKSLANKDKAQVFNQFFKTGPGQYAEGDIFLGVSVPQSRKIATENKNLSYQDLSVLIRSKYHEQRFISLVILTERFKKDKQKCYQFYLDNLDYVNNWDLVDVSCYKIVGAFLLENRKEIPILKELANSGHLWRKRVAMISTMAFIKKKENQHTYEIAKILLEDEHDLIHKAVGWMLREAGKNDEKKLEQFLKQHYDVIPRTCLRYAIEKFEESKRKAMLKKQF